jgi:cell division septal protein FtsQ
MVEINRTMKNKKVLREREREREKEKGQQKDKQMKLAIGVFFSIFVCGGCMV